MSFKALLISILAPIALYRMVRDHPASFQRLIDALPLPGPGW